MDNLVNNIVKQPSVLDIKYFNDKKSYTIQNSESIITLDVQEQEVYKTILQMEKAATNLDFIEAARLRDEMFRLQKELQEMK